MEGRHTVWEEYTILEQPAPRLYKQLLYYKTKLFTFDSGKLRGGVAIIYSSLMKLLILMLKSLFASYFYSFSLRYNPCFSFLQQVIQWLPKENHILLTVPHLYHTHFSFSVLIEAVAFFHPGTAFSLLLANSFFNIKLNFCFRHWAVLMPHPIFTHSFLTIGFCLLVIFSIM